MIWLSFAEKEFEPEFEIALSEDLFDRPCFNCSASERIDWMTVRHRPTCLLNRSTSWRWPTLSLSIFRKPQTLGLQYSHRGQEAWEKLAVEFCSALLHLETLHRS
jgi:hypothetical protein